MKKAKRICIFKQVTFILAAVLMAGMMCVAFLYALDTEPYTDGTVPERVLFISKGDE